MTVPVIHIEVRGRVQGVGFRWYIRERARLLNLAGWVRNLNSGALEIAATGPEDAVDQLLGAVREGPPGSEVREVVLLSGLDASALSTPFSIVR